MNRIDFLRLRSALFTAIGVALVALALSWRPGFTDDGATVVADDLRDAIQTAQLLKDRHGN